MEVPSVSRGAVEGCAGVPHPGTFRRALSGAILEWPAWCEELYGYGASRAIGRNANELLGTGPEALLSGAQKRLVDGHAWEGILQQRDEKGRPLMVFAKWRRVEGNSPAEDPEIVEELANLTAYLGDLGAGGDARARLALVEAELESAQEEGVRFSRAISHGLAAPLTSTRWLLEALESRAGASLSQDGHKLLATALKNLDEMTGLIEALSNHQRIGRQSLNTSRATSSRKAVDAALAKLRQPIVDLQAEVSIGELPPLMVEPTALACLFENLIGNALKFQPTARVPRVLVTAEKQDGRWLFRVEDNGIGIDPRAAERIFQPLQRLNPHIPGRGIGLATCRKIVERTGGRIWTEPAPRQGAVFCFTLPGEGSGAGGPAGSEG